MVRQDLARIGRFRDIKVLVFPWPFDRKPPLPKGSDQIYFDPRRFMTEDQMDQAGLRITPIFGGKYRGKSALADLLEVEFGVMRLGEVKAGANRPERRGELIGRRQLRRGDD